MKLYHGSPNNFLAAKKSQAQQGEGFDVPKDELLDAIYLTPDFEFALVFACTPEGAAKIDHEQHTIELENPQLFDPEKTVYVYEFDSASIPPGNLKFIDERQYAVIGTTELKPTAVTPHKAGEITKYYEIISWQKENREMSSRFRRK